MSEINIVYGLYESPEILYKKPSSLMHPDQEPGKNLKQITSVANTTSIGYLSSWIGKEGGTYPQITSDLDSEASVLTNYVSIGYRNFKTQDLLNNSANKILIIKKLNERLSIVSVPTGEVYAKSETDYDYGIIVKINPEPKKELQNNSWICCAGLGVWGTRGAAWYLTHHWRKIHAETKGLPFAYLLKIKVGSDETTTAIRAWRLGCHQIEEITI